MERTCVLGAESNVTLVLGLFASVADKALSCNIEILVFVVTTFVGSAPVDKDIEALPDVSTGSSNTEVSVFEKSVFGFRLSAVNFDGSKLIDNFTKET